MLKQVLFVFFCLSFLTLNAQSYWKKSDIVNFRTASEDDMINMPTKYQAFSLTFDALLADLKDVPSEAEKASGVSGKTILIPMADGTLEPFEIYDSPVMELGLASRYPSIKSYKGKSVNNSSTNIRFDTGPYGFHGAIQTTHENYYIDPYARGNNWDYISYNVKDQLSQIDLDVPLCGTEESLKEDHIDDLFGNRRLGEKIPLRKYRFALACTGEWGAVRGSVENALADMNTSVNRINQIYENELAMRLVLIANNDLLIHIDGSMDPYNVTSSGGAMLSVNTGILNTLVGVGAYDLGHVYHNNCDVGGIASLGSMCNTNKGAGVTCHYFNNLDFFASIVTSHEIGHQMSAQHTFNNCDGNESLGNGFEPGSGTTIMSYAGLCGPDLNVVGNGQGDDYYHVASLIQIYNHTRDGGTADACAELVETENEAPVITLNYENFFTIPTDTYFYLEGSATDVNEDELTYCWEAMSSGPQSPLGSPIGNAPRFRSFRPNTSPVRYFPSADNILSLTFDKTEVLPQTNLELRFMFTVRDNNSEAGTAAWEDVRFMSKTTSEKFEITSQNTQTSTTVGEELTVEWTVAGTDKAPFNAPFVDILFNTENASGFDLKTMEVLAERVPNNGSAKVYMPNILTNKGRIIVKASDGIFFTINSRNIQIKEPDSPSIFFAPSPSALAVCLPAEPSIEIQTEAFAGLEGNVHLSIINGLPAGATANFVPPVIAAGESSTLNIEFESGTISDTYTVEVEALVEGIDTFSRDIILYVTDTDHSALIPLGPGNGEAGVGVAPTFSWSKSPNALTYSIELASSPAFGLSTIIKESNITDTFYIPSTILEKSTVYYWKIIPSNLCGEGSSLEISAFSTEVLACSEYVSPEGELPINISGSGTPTIEAPVEISTTGNVADVNIKHFMGEHGNDKDLTVHLISPAGKEVLLFSNICELPDFNCSFDDASNSAVKCPLNNGSTYRPKEKLSAFNGDPIEGTWILRIQDTKSGNGGRLENFILEICGNQALESPFLVNNKLIKVGWGGTRTISTDLLKVDDNNNTNEELIYTVVELPALGELRFDNISVLVGDQFSQKDIDENKLSYTGVSENIETYFSFTVIDGEGGFIGITNFNIQIDALHATYDETLALEILVYPNPARETINIDVSNARKAIEGIELINLQGQVMLSDYNIKSELITLDVHSLPSGMYILNVKNGNISIPKKIIIE